MFSLHAGVAAITKCPELEIAQDDAKALSTAITAVAAHYQYTMDPKYLAWAGLLGTMGAIYGPRIAIIRMRKSAERKNAPRPAQGAQIVAPQTQGVETAKTAAPNAIDSLLNDPDLFSGRMQ